MFRASHSIHRDTFKRLAEKIAQGHARFEPRMDPGVPPPARSLNAVWIPLARGSTGSSGRARDRSLPATAGSTARRARLCPTRAAGRTRSRRRAVRRALRCRLRPPSPVPRSLECCVARTDEHHPRPERAAAAQDALPDRLLHFAGAAPGHPLPDLEVVLLHPVLEQPVGSLELHAADIVESARRLIVEPAVPAAQIGLHRGDASEARLGASAPISCPLSAASPVRPDSTGRSAGTRMSACQLDVCSQYTWVVVLPRRAHAGGCVARVQCSLPGRWDSSLSSGQRRDDGCAVHHAPEMPPSTPIVARLAACRSAYEDAHASRTAIRTNE